MKHGGQRVMNLAHMLRRSARRHPDAVAIARDGVSISWAELDARVDAFCNVLASRGVAKGDRVLVQSRNSHQLVETMFACFRIGAVWVPTNFRQTPEEIVWLARSSGAVMMVCDDHFPEHAAACRLPTITIGSGGEDDYDALVAVAKGNPLAEAGVDYHDPCWFFFTSGTTGRPKAAVLTHGQLAFVINNHLCDLMPGTGPDDASLVVAPLTHGAGVHLLTQVARGAKTILPAGDRFDAEEAWKLVEAWRVTNMFTVPTILKLLVEHPSVEHHDLSSLRYVVYAGAPMYRADQKRALSVLGSVLVQYFGLGEVTGAITVLRPEDHHIEDGPEVKAMTCGAERTGMQVSIQDDEGRELGLGETGEICVCGPAVFAGYYDNDEANSKAFRNGWFRTGDIGHMDSEGDLFITGRASDMYISGGSNIYPREIEEKMLAHEAVSEVAVVGVPDAVWGEVGIAICVPTIGAAVGERELLDWLKGRIASYKLPKRVIFWDALPKSGYGKVVKATVRAALADQGVYACP